MCGGEGGVVRQAEEGGGEGLEQTTWEGNITEIFMVR